MSKDVTPNQALLLFGLLGVHGECAQAELMPAATKADREALSAAGLIDVRKSGRAFFLGLTDRGWDWASANLSAELPPPQKALHDLLGRLGDHLSANGGSLAAFIGSKPNKKVSPKPQASKPAAAAKPATKPRKAASPSKTTTKKTVPATKATKAKATEKVSKPKAPTAAALRQRIEAAYLSLTGGRKNESVRLAHLRGEMRDLDRKTVDKALGRLLKGDETASLMRHDDPAQLNQADHAAAFDPAGEPFHVIWIAS